MIVTERFDLLKLIIMPKEMVSVLEYNPMFFSWKKNEKTHLFHSTFFIITLQENYMQKCSGSI